MGSFFQRRFYQSRRKSIASYLAFVWLAGLLLGSALAMSPGSTSDSLMRSVFSSTVSISGLLATLYLPLLFSAFAVYISQIWLLIPICFFKALFFSYIAAKFSLLLLSGSWLFRFLFLFSDCLTVPVLYLIWYRAFHRDRREVFCSCLLAGFLFLLIGIVDYRCISPFLIRLL